MGESEKGASAASGPGLGEATQPALPSHAGINSDLFLNLPAAAPRSARAGESLPGTLARLGPHVGCNLRAPGPRPRASPSPRFNYVIDFRFGRIGTPLPPTGVYLSVPFLSFRVLPTGCNLETAAGPAAARLAAASPYTPTKWSPAGSARPGLQPAGHAGPRPRSCPFSLLNYFVLHYSRIEKRSVFEGSLRARGWAGLPAGPPPRPDAGCVGRSAWDPRERDPRPWARRGAPAAPPESRPRARGPEAPREANMATTFHHYAPERDLGWRLSPQPALGRLVSRCSPASQRPRRHQRRPPAPPPRSTGQPLHPRG